MRWVRRGISTSIPNSRNVIPGKVVFTVDFRSPDLSVIEDMEAQLKAGAPKICDDMGLGVEFEKVGGFDPVAFDEGCVTAVRNAAERLGYSHRNLDLGRGPRRLLDQPRGADGDGDVPLRRRAVAQRGRGDFAANGPRRGRMC